MRHDEHERLTPLLPPLVQFNTEPGDDLAEGQIVELRVRVEVQSFVPTPIPEGSVG